ncbi:MAG TPA: pyruvate kinase [Acidimicrobiales bacterium]|nr:pyruvate kinase [Acidimicrobiales bacterium]
MEHAGEPVPGRYYGSGAGATPFLREVAARASARATTRRTRIVATIGPASDSPETIAAMAAAGMDVARIPLAHGSIDEAIARVRRVREAAPEVGVLADLPGPKIRSSPFREGGVMLVADAEVRLVPGSRLESSSAQTIGIALDEVAAGLEQGDTVALGDGGVSLEVVRREGDAAIARVLNGGHVQGRPGVTVPSSRVQLATPTKDDLARLEALVAEGVELIAVSFVRSAADMLAVRSAVGDASTMLVAKIETADAITDLDAILAVADAVMVARGDLGVRVPLEDVPHHQKRIIRSGVRYGRPVITATQMLESMITSPVPTRAEVTDVANAVLDGTSAVMLSGETAIGHDPTRVVATMARIVSRTEQDFDYLHWGANLGVQEVAGDASSPARITAAITGAAWRAAIEQDASAIIACTRSGATARVISRFRPSMPIVAATPSLRTVRQLSMSWGVDALLVRESTSTDDIVWFAVKRAVEEGYAKPGDVVVVLAGSPNEPEPVTDTLRIVRVS